MQSVTQRGVGLWLLWCGNSTGHSYVWGSVVGWHLPRHLAELGTDSNLRLGSYLLRHFPWWEIP